MISLTGQSGMDFLSVKRINFYSILSRQLKSLNLNTSVGGGLL
jgi:hypothetical protein